MKLHWPEAEHIYLSPHPDDAVLSCGGMIWEQAERGESVAVMTVFAASPSPSLPISDFAQELHRRWQESAPPSIEFSDPSAARRAEDVESFARLHRRVQLVHLPFTDCIYRMNPHTEEPLYASEAAIFGTVHPADPVIAALEIMPPLVEEVTIYSPLAVGRHVDHQVLRRAVEGWGLPADRLRYYEDYPYVLEPGALEAVIDPHGGWLPVVIPLSDAALEAKSAAMAAHASQISSFWPSLDAMAAAFRQRASEIGGERLWIHAGKP